MKKLYDKSKLAFALVWIGIYIVSLSVADELSKMLSIEKVITAPLCLILTAFLFIWLKKQGLLCEYGICKPTCLAKRFLFYLPLLVIVSVNFWGGVSVSLSAVEILLYVISMLCVGFLEEIVFRGFLFVSMKQDNLVAAVIVSSITFGIGHIINLLSGAQLVSTLLQIVYATAAGFLFTIIFLKSGSLLFCILTHSLLNATSFLCSQDDKLLIISSIVLTLVSVVYAFIVLLLNKKDKSDKELEIKQDEQGEK